MQVDPRLTEGIHLFNKQEFFECHEVIESLWLEVKGEYRDFYKGLIQAAVAIHHFKKDNLSGALGLYKSSTEYLTAYPAACLGVENKKFISDMQFCFKDLVKSGSQSKAKIREELIPKIQTKN